MPAIATRYPIVVLFLVPAVIHLLPLSGLMGADALSRLYGQDFSQPDLLVLMRHRAVLFGMLGGLLLAAAFRASLRTPALWAGYVSVLSFLLIAAMTDGHGPAVARVVVADGVALASLVLASVLHWRPSPVLPRVA